jgi:transcriptional regulator with XRE-family HTH domain
MSINMKSPHEMVVDIARQAKEKRLAMNLSQQTLSKRSGVSYGTLKKFEQTGQISLESLLKIALALDAFDAFDTLFTNKPEELPASLDELLEENTRKRGRK